MTCFFFRNVDDQQAINERWVYRYHGRILLGQTLISPSDIVVVADSRLFKAHASVRAKNFTTCSSSSICRCC